MRFIAPAALSWLIATLFVIALHRLRPRPQQTVVPSLLLWHHVETAMATQRRWRRLLKTLLLFTHVLITVLLALALARPVWQTPAQAPYTIHIIDISASMAAADVAPNRLELAKIHLIEHIKSQPGPVTIVTVGATAHIVYEGNDSAMAAAVVNTVTTEATTPHWADAAASVQSLTPAPDLVTVWTDGATDPVQFASLAAVAGDRLNVRFVGSDDAANVAITAFDMQQKGADQLAYQLLLEITNFGSQPVVVPWHITVDDTALAADTVLLAAGGTDRLLFDIPRLTGRIVRAHIEPAAADGSSTPVDYLTEDNSAAIVTRQPQLSHVALIGGGHNALQRGLRIFPHVRLQHKLAISTDDTFHLAIHQGSLRQVVPGHHVVIPLPTAELNPPRPATVTWADPLHQLTRHIDWHQLRIDHAQPVANEPGRHVLVDSDVGPLLTVEPWPGGFVLRLGFALEQSDLTGRVAFPVLLSNILQYAHPAGWEGVQPATPVGTMHRVGSPEADAPIVSDPHGTPLPLRETDEGLWVIPTAAGVHYVTDGTGRNPFVVGVPGQQNSDLRRRLQHVPVTDNSIAPPMSFWDRPLEVWLIIAALILLFGETWLFTNRSHRTVTTRLGRGDAH